MNLLKFPPGFFGDDPFKALDSRASKKRSRERTNTTESELDDGN
jgi:hypothetical protein